MHVCRQYFTHGWTHLPDSLMCVDVYMCVWDVSVFHLREEWLKLTPAERAWTIKSYTQTHFNLCHILLAYFITHLTHSCVFSIMFVQFQHEQGSSVDWINVLRESTKLKKIKQMWVLVFFCFYNTNREIHTLLNIHHTHHTHKGVVYINMYK